MPQDKRRIALLVSYDGGSWHGWQIQDNSPTVQETIENALEHYNIALTESTSVKDKALDNVVLRELYINKAYSEYKMNNYLGCLASIDKISKNNGNSTLEHKILNLKGMVLYNMKQYIEAINEFEMLLLCPSS